MHEELFEYSLSSTWEWREGRLFAYELILKYLIANHIHYVFPSYAFSYSPRQASCSVDEAMLKRYEESLPYIHIVAYNHRIDAAMIRND